MSCRCGDTARCRCDIGKLSKALGKEGKYSQHITPAGTNIEKMHGKVVFLTESETVKQGIAEMPTMHRDIERTKGDIVGKIQDKKGELEELLRSMESEDKKFHEEERRKKRHDH